MGEVLVQRELGETLRRMARAEATAGGSREAGIRAARDEFYRGETAKRIAEFHRAEGGPLAASDLAEFSVEVGPALRTNFGRYEVAACGFWCQGPSFLQMLNLLDGIDLKALGHNSAAYLHRIIETIKLAFADRDAYYGDPHFVKVPADGLLSKAYAAARRELVKERAWPRCRPPAIPTGSTACGGRKRRCRSREAHTRYPGKRPTRSTPATSRSWTRRATASRPRRAIQTSTRPWSPGSAASCRREGRKAGWTRSTRAWSRRASGRA